jgi:biotin carboxyl carrier protein
MKLEVQVGGGKDKRTVELEHDESGWKGSIEGSNIKADIVEVSSNVFSVICEGQSCEVRVTPCVDGTLSLHVGSREMQAEVIDPRAWSGRRHGHVEAEGRQQIVAPMPGKVVRVLVTIGDHVETGQGLFVVEAMKMQNEIRSTKRGKIERVLAQAGQTVTAGEILCWVE